MFLQGLACVYSVLMGSFGEHDQCPSSKTGLNVFSTNTYAMLYGALTMLLVIVLTQTPFQIETTISYLSALLYLAIFGSIIGFGCYFSLIGRIGIAAAAYTTVLFPLVALSIFNHF
ncbi:EamA family transporter [Vibrio sp. PP-XX7]